MAQPLTAIRQHNPRRQENGAEEPWVLLVEQQGRPSHALVRQLRDRIRVDLVHDHVTTYALAFEGVFDAIILHRPLEGARGSIALCGELRRNGVTTPILLLAQQASVDDIVDALDAGADDVMTEPFAVELLIARLRAFQHRTAFRATPPRLRVGDLLLEGEDGGGSPRRPPGLVEDVADAVVHGSAGGDQPIGNLPVGEAARQEC